MSSSQYQVLTPELRHVCNACGGSCNGVFVRMQTEEEKERIRDVGEKLGVPNPIVDGRLRTEGGVCVFLGEDGLCNIHRKYGLETKPVDCQQWPTLAIATRTGNRVAIDPGCYTSILSWRDGEVVSEYKVDTPRIDIPEEQEPFEENMLDMLGVEGMTLAVVAMQLTGERMAENGGLPPQFARRIITRLQAADLASVVENTAPKVNRTMMPLLQSIQSWDPDNPPAWSILGEYEESYAVDAMRRMLFLRLAHRMPVVAGVSMLMLIGCVACAWHTQDRLEFGTALAAWFRCIRSPKFWMRIVPDAQTLTWLARGDVGLPR